MLRKMTKIVENFVVFDMKIVQIWLKLNHGKCKIISWTKQIKNFKKIHFS